MMLLGRKLERLPVSEEFYIYISCALSPQPDPTPPPVCVQRHHLGSHCCPVVCAGVCTDTSQSQATAVSSGGLVSTAVQPALKIRMGFVPVVFLSADHSMTSFLHYLLYVQHWEHLMTV